jgi:thiol-disulfide isomerase/thioredoxin
MRRLVPFAVALLVIWLAACGEDTAQGKKGKGRGSEPNVNFPAPEIEGSDANGKPFRLSDYKGKVVLLDFWASWCKPCRILVPHEKALVKSLKDKPFVLLGVNGDDTPEDLKEAEQQQGLNWRSWWDEGKSIQRRWGVKVLPTVFLIDHKGVVRYRFEGVGPTTEEDLDAAVKDLLRKASGEEK